MKIRDKIWLVLDMPHDPKDATLSFPFEGLLSTQEIFEPYLGKDISITIEKEKGKVQKIIIKEEIQK